MPKAKIKIVAKQVEGNRWKWGAPSVLKPGTYSYSGRTYGSKSAALKAGRREFNV